MLYNHYEKISNRDKYSSSLYRTRIRIKEIQEDLKDCNFNLSSDIQSTDYSKEVVVTSEDNTSSMERCLIREETRLERELEEEIRCKFTLKRKIRNLQKQIDDIEIILEQIPSNYIPFIEALYKDKLTYRGAGYLLHCGKDAIGRNKKELIDRLMKLL